MMVFLPCRRSEAVQRRTAEVATEGSLTGYAATEALLRHEGFDDSMLEDADYVALLHAGAASVLLDHPDPLRLVLAVQPPVAGVRADPDDPFGATQVTGLRWSDVWALFVDEPAAADAVAAARAAAAGLDLPAAWSLPAVETLVDEHDLLWFAPEELDSLP